MSEENATPAASASPSSDALTNARHEKCPHCGNTTLIEPSQALLFRCGVCGKARVPVELEGFKRSDEEIPILARASANHTAALAWVAGSAVLGAFALIGLGALGLVMSALNPGLVPMLFGLLICLLPAGLAGYGLRRAAQLRALVEPALEDGWLRVTREVTEAKGSISDVQLAKILRVDRTRAEQLLAQLSATSTIRHRIEEPAPLTFEAPKLRVKDTEADAERDESDLEALEASEKKTEKKNASEQDA